MSLLYTSLKSIYNSNDYYNSFAPLEQLHFSLKNYLSKNIQQSNYFIDSSDFSHDFHLEIMKSLDLFLLLSEHGIFEKNYEIICDECGSPSIESNINNLYECITCKSLFLNLSKPDISAFFQNVKYLFEINEDVLIEMQDDIKNPPPSSLNELFEVEGDAIPSSETVLKCNDSHLRGIAHENDILKTLSEGILNFS